MNLGRAKARPLALVDVAAIVEGYLDEGADGAALRFVDELESAAALLGDNPGIGSPRVAAATRIATLRSWSLGRVPHLLLYVVHEGVVEIVRVLHSSRDVPATLAAHDDVGPT